MQQTEGMPVEVWERTIRINLTGTFYCCRAAIPYLKRRPGAAIVNISSSSVLVGGGGGAHYAATKAGIDGLTRHLAPELALEIHAPLEQEKVMNQIPLRRVGQPEDIADAVAFLASDWASYITGQILLIDGGRTYQRRSDSRRLGRVAAMSHFLGEGAVVATVYRPRQLTMAPS